MPDDEVLLAFEALERSGLPARGLSHLWYPFELEGRHELAFRMSSGLTSAQSIAGVEFLTASYQMLKQLKGDAQALDWIRGRLLPQGMVSPEDLELLMITDDPAEAVKSVLDSYHRLYPAGGNPHEPEKPDAR